MRRLYVLNAVLAIVLATGGCNSAKRVVDCHDDPSDGDRCTGPGEGYICRQGYYCHAGCASECECVAGTWRCRYRCVDNTLDGGAKTIQCGTPPMCWRVCGTPPPGIDAGP